MAAIKIEDLSKRFDIGGRTIDAVNSIDCEIKDGSLTTIVGPSGCGKTTFLRMIAGLEKPTEGKIFFDDKDVTYMRPQDRQISMVFQNITLFPFKSIRDNILYGLKYTNMESDEKYKLINNMTDILEISDLLDKNPNQLSGGQQQRVALARSLIRDPDVFLLDEPMSSLDEQIRLELRSELKELHREVEKTTLYVTHNQEQAMTLADDIIVMNDGQIEQQSSPIEAYNSPKSLFVANFIGSPNINTFSCELNNNELNCEEMTRPISLETDLDTQQQKLEDRVIIGIRPEDISLANSKENVISGVVKIIERMGDKDVVHIDLDRSNRECRIVMPAGSGITEDEQHSFSFNFKKVHLFDKKTSNALFHGSDLITSQMTMS